MIKTTLKVLLFSLVFFCFSIVSRADLPPDPGTGGPGTGGVPVGGGSSLGGSLIILLSLGITYGSYKIYKSWSPVVE